jgi:predicted transcriptional regulator
MDGNEKRFHDERRMVMANNPNANGNRDFTQELGYKLRTIREYLNLNAVEASKKFDFASGQISNYESGSENPNLLYVCKLTNEAGLKVEDLLLDMKDFMGKLWFK